MIVIIVRLLREPQLGPHPILVSPATTLLPVAVTGISAKEGQSSDTDGAAGAAD